MNLFGWIRQKFFESNENGIPVPLLRDPDKNGPDIYFSFIVLTGGVILLGLIGKFTKLVGDIDMTGALVFFGTVAGLHSGHKMVLDAQKKTVQVDGTEKKDEEDVKPKE